MSHLLLAAFAMPALLAAVLPLALGRSRLGTDNRFLSGLLVLATALYLGLGAYLAATARLPLYLLGNHYLFIDRLTLYEMLVTGLVFFLAALYARGYVASLLQQGDLDASLLRLFYGSMALLELVLTLGFMSNNLALLWICVELSTLFTSVLIVTLRAKENILAALKYVFVASTAMLFSFLGVILLFAASKTVVAGGTVNWSELMAAAGQLSPGLYSFAFVFLFIGFAAKSGIVPFHTWLPAAYIRAPSVVAVVSGIVLNLGMYALVRLVALGHRAGADGFLGSFLLAFGVLTVALAALSLLPRTNTKKLIAFSGIEQMGLMLLALGLGTPLTLFWALFNMLAHGLTKALLFFTAGVWHRQYQSNKYYAVRAPFRLQPLASWGLVVGSLAAVGVPLLPIFLVEFNVLGALTARSAGLAALVLLLLLLVVAGFGRYFLLALSQRGGDEPRPFRVPLSMGLPIVLSMLCLFLLGLYLPGWLTQTLQSIVAELGF